MPCLSGRTTTTAALNLPRRAVFQTSAADRPSAPDVSILANDELTLDGDRMSTEATACRDAGIVMVVAAADRTMADSIELKSIVGPPAARHCFTTKTMGTLSDLMVSFLPAALLCPGIELIMLQQFLQRSSTFLCNGY